LDGSNNQMFGSYGRKRRDVQWNNASTWNEQDVKNSLEANSQERLFATIRVFAEGEEEQLGKDGQLAALTDLDSSIYG